MKYLAILIIFYSISMAQHIDIRPPNLNELPSVLELDERVTYEFFKPLYTDMYNHLKLNRDVDKDLQEELADDKKTFPTLIKDQGSERLHIAWDAEQKKPCGLLVFSKQENSEVILDLLLVDKHYRGKGIGRALVYSVFQAFENIKTIIVYPVQLNNEGTLKFYKALGFKDLGVGPEDNINSHGIRYSDMYYYFRLDINNSF